MAWGSVNIGGGGEAGISIVETTLSVSSFTINRLYNSTSTDVSAMMTSARLRTWSIDEQPIRHQLVITFNPGSEVWSSHSGWYSNGLYSLLGLSGKSWTGTATEHVKDTQLTFRPTKVYGSSSSNVFSSSYSFVWYNPHEVAQGAWSSAGEIKLMFDISIM